MNILKILSIRHVIAKIRFFFAPFLKESRRSIFMYNINLSINIVSYPGRVLWAYRELYEAEDINCVCDLVHTGGTVIDVGANVGLYSVLLAKAVGLTGRVFAFEANPAEIALLRHNCSNYPQVTVIPAYCSDRDSDTREQVNIRVDSVIFNPVHFIKIDVDGVDLAVLRGCEKLIAKYRPIILCEVSPDSFELHGIHFTEVIDWLVAFGYSVHQPKPKIPKFESRSISRVQNLLFLPVGFRG